MGRSDEDGESLPSPVERAQICRELNWRLLPWELDDLDIAEVKVPLTLLRVYDIFRKYSGDINKLTETEAEVVGSIETLREILDDEV